MKFEEFTELLVDCMKARLEPNDSGIQIKTDKILKNNGVTLTALNIRKTSQNICPTIYIEPYYREFEKGRSMADICSSIIDIYRRNGTDDRLTFEKVMDESDVKNNIILRIVNREKNRKLLETVPYVEYQNMAVTFRRVIEVSDTGISSSGVTNSDMDRWRLDLDTMYRLALANTERLFPPVIKDLFSVLEDRYDYSVSENIGQAPDIDELYVMTNEYDINGASVILYDGTLARCADMVDDDIYILPCSVHELLFIRAHCSFGEDYLKNLVHEANRSAITPMEFLSDSIYVYRRDSGELTEIV